MLRQCRWVAVVAMLLSCSVASAQRPGGGQGGFGGGQGGFGGGFGGPGGGMNSPFTLVRNEAVQKELNLSDEQVGDLKTLGDKYSEEMRSAGGGREAFQGLQDLSREEREKKMAELFAKGEEARKKVSEKFQPDLDKILEAGQRDRLKQIQIQADGTRAYQNADVVAALKISKEQQDKFAAINKEFGDKSRELFAGGGAGGFSEENRKKSQELRDARDKQLAEVLTADQKSALEKMKGKPFADLDKLRPTFGGGRGGPGQGGGANPGGRPQRRPQGGDKKAEEKKSDN